MVSKFCYIFRENRLSSISLNLSLFLKHLLIWWGNQGNINFQKLKFYWWFENRRNKNPHFRHNLIAKVLFSNEWIKRIYLIWTKMEHHLHLRKCIQTKRLCYFYKIQRMIMVMIFKLFEGKKCESKDRWFRGCLINQKVLRDLIFSFH